MDALELGSSVDKRVLCGVRQYERGRIKGQRK